MTIKVFYTWSQSESGIKYDPGFKKEITWDIPLLEGYDDTFVNNTSADPGSHHFKGIVNPTLIAEIEAWKPDALLVFGWAFKSHLKCLRYFHKKLPLLFRGDSTLLDEQPGIKMIARRLFLRWVYQHVDKALYVGTQNKRYYLAHGLKENQLILAPHAIDNERFYDTENNYARKAEAWRAQLTIPNTSVVFLYAGKLEAKKGIAVLIDAFLSVNDPVNHLVIVGNGPLEERLKMQAAGSAHIHFIGFQNQRMMPVVYRLGDVFVLPSVGPGETWGLGVNEAMACGKAVVVSDKAGCAVDLVRHGENGYVFAAGDAGDLADKLGRFKSVEQALEMGERSGEIIKGYSLQRVAEAIRF